MVETYRVAGMTCQGCARSVIGALNRLAPEAKVTVDLAAGTVTIARASGKAGEGAIGAEAVRRAVEGAGFDFTGALG